MYGRDHAGVGTYYGAYDAHRMLEALQKELTIIPVYSENWLFCPHCGEITSRASAAIKRNGKSSAAP